MQDFSPHCGETTSTGGDTQHTHGTALPHPTGVGGRRPTRPRPPHQPRADPPPDRAGTAGTRRKRITAELVSKSSPPARCEGSSSSLRPHLAAALPSGLRPLRPPHAPQPSDPSPSPAYRGVRSRSPHGRPTQGGEHGTRPRNPTRPHPGR